MSVPRFGVGVVALFVWVAGDLPAAETPKGAASQASRRAPRRLGVSLSSRGQTLRAPSR